MTHENEVPLTFACAFALYYKARVELLWYKILISRIGTAEKSETAMSLLAAARESSEKWSAMLSAVYRSDYAEDVFEKYKNQR